MAAPSSPQDAADLRKTQLKLHRAPPATTVDRQVELRLLLRIARRFRHSDWSILDLVHEGDRALSRARAGRAPGCSAPVWLRSAERAVCVELERTTGVAASPPAPRRVRLWVRPITPSQPRHARELAAQHQNNER